jgi:hypothetical protein
VVVTPSTRLGRDRQHIFALFFALSLLGMLARMVIFLPTRRTDAALPIQAICVGLQMVLSGIDCPRQIRPALCPVAAMLAPLAP